MYESVSLGDLAKFLNGGTPRREVARYYNGNIPWITSSDLKEGSDYVSEARFHITEEAIESSATRIVPKGNLLFVSRTGVGKIAIAGTDVCISQDFTGIVPNTNLIDTRYLFRFLQAKQAYFVSLQRGATIKGVTRRVIEELGVPLPPLPEQRRIAAILDAADGLRAKRRAALGKLDALVQAVFLEMFGDPVGNEKGWEVVSLGEISDVKGGKRLPKGEDYSPIPTPYQYIRIADIEEGHINLDTLKYLHPSTQSKIARYVVNEGDVIITIAGTLGLTVPVGPELNGINLTENAAKLVPKKRGLYTANYLSYALQLPYYQEQIGAYTGQVTIGKLALFRIEKIRILLPPIELQQRYDLWAEKHEKQLESFKSHLVLLDRLFSSLQQRAFRGEL